MLHVIFFLISKIQRFLLLARTLPSDRSLQWDDPGKHAYHKYKQYGDPFQRPANSMLSNLQSVCNIIGYDALD